MRIIKFVGLIILTVLIAACSTSAGSLTNNLKFQNKEISEVMDTSSITNAVNKSGLDIFKKRVIHDKNGNVVISPVSLFSAFSLLSNGADGDTRKQIDNVFYLDKFKKEKLNQGMNSIINSMNQRRYEENTGKINIYNSIWAARGFEIEDEFLNISKVYYDSDVFKKDFSNKSTVDDMNRWVNEKSDGLIKSPFDRLDEQDRIILMNLLNFKGRWVNEFNKDLTREEKFYLKDNTAVNAKLMNKETMMSYYEDEEVKSGVLSYYNGSMLVLLPNGNIDEFINGLTVDKIKSYRDNSTNSIVKLKMPKFNVECKEDISETLKQLGINDAFDTDEASFKALHKDTQPLWIGKVLHDCVIRVDEEGTSGAALTSVVLCGAARPDGIKELYINKPFVFIIQDNSGTCLFIGKVENIK